VHDGKQKAHALFFQAQAHAAANDPHKAEACLREALALCPDLPQAHTNLALLLEQRGALAEAEAHFQRAIELAPDKSLAHLNYGSLLADQKRLPEAEQAYRRALALNPDSPRAWSNLGVLQACLHREEAAEASYFRALELCPDHRLALFNLSYLRLRQGRYLEGWRYLESRNWYGHLLEALGAYPRWQGEPLTGKSLLIGFEGGHGDMIQLSRYAAVLREKGAAHLALICHPALKRLFRSLDSLDELFDFTETIADFSWDFWVPPFSLPYLLETTLETIPAEIPYLRAEPALLAVWSERVARLAAPGTLRVGLVWKGSPGFENDLDRSLAGLATLAPLAGVAGVTYFSLQKGDAAFEAASPAPPVPLADLAPQIDDFADTAAILENLDLVISVDTAVAHLAGALGKACWLLLPDYKTDWRWLTGRDDSPWYPKGMRLFRQSGTGEWGEVVSRLSSALAELAERRGGL